MPLNTRVVAEIHLPDTDDHFPTHLLKEPLFNGRGTYQFAKLNAAIDHVPKGRRELALDIGAHVGLWTRVLSYHFQKVYAFEPMFEHAHCWKQNQDHWDKVKLFEFAVGAKEDKIMMKRVRGNSGNARVDTSYSGDLSVKMVTLDSWANMHLPDLDLGFIKIDVEGFELPVVQGGEQLIKAFKPTMVVEQKRGNAEMCGFKTGEVINLLRSWGARIVWERSGDFCLTFEK